jgi:hypothetical protein
MRCGRRHKVCGGCACLRAHADFIMRSRQEAHLCNSGNKAENASDLGSRHDVVVMHDSVHAR